MLEVSLKRYQLRAVKQFSKHTDRTATVSNPTTTDAGVLGAAPVEAKNPVNYKRDDKLSAFMTQRKKMGLCMKCGDKWERVHKCPQHIFLHIMEKLLEAVQESSVDDSSSTDTSSDEELLSLSLSATVGIQGKKTMRLQGTFKGHEILILVDSGSSSTFISASLVQKLACTTEPIEAATVIVANGATLPCNTRVPNVTWCTQGHSFTMEARVMDLKHYDMDLGIDWLEDHSPMWVD
jgi:predicted aspartyl protease